jgi:hypothetical protein
MASCICFRTPAKVLEGVGHCRRRKLLGFRFGLGLGLGLGLGFRVRVRVRV